MGNPVKSQKSLGNEDLYGFCAWWFRMKTKSGVFYTMYRHNAPKILGGEPVINKHRAFGGVIGMKKPPTNNRGRL